MSQNENQPQGNENKPVNPADRAAKVLQHLQQLQQKPEMPTQQDNPDDTPDFTRMPPQVYLQLPPLLQECTNMFEDEQEREIFLIGALGIISGIMPNVQGTYFGRNVGTNLYCFIIGQYGTGKGSLVWAKDLGMAIEQHRTDMAKEAVTAYNNELAEYQKQLRLYERGKLNDLPLMPQPPKHLRLFLPANTSKTAVMQLLMENDGRGIIFETEGDTLADMLRQDYGNFSDVLRKAYHHEPVSYYRRKDSEDVMIHRPALSVVMSGTHEQVRRLIPSVENGLYSRFCFYHLHGNAPFRNPFAATHDYLAVDVATVANTLCNMYKRLNNLPQPAQFHLQPHQQQHFNHTFIQVKEDLRHNISHELEGMTNRMALICYRIAMILTVLRSPALNSGQQLQCTDADYHNAVAIAQHLLQHSLHVYEQLQQHPAQATRPIPDKKERIEECCRQFGLGIVYSQIAEAVLGNSKLGGTIHKWVAKYCKKSA